MKFVPYLVLFALTCVTAIEAQNVLILQADDLGREKIGCYGYAGAARTPHIDALAARGIRFANCYSNPLCSPTRATILTGEYSFRHLIGRAINANHTHGLNPSLPYLLPKVLPRHYAKVALGKWHLGVTPSGGPWHPVLCGFDLYVGALNNLVNAENYFAYTKTITTPAATQSMRSQTYITQDTAQDCMAALDYFRQSTQPFFLYCNFHAIHEPWHYPPGAVSQPPTLDFSNEAKAMTEYLDARIGEIMQHVNLRTTTVIFVSDNGSAGQTMPWGSWLFRGMKGTVYEGGVHVPLIVAGQAATWTGTSSALVNTTDLFTTVLGIAYGQQFEVLDSVSLLAHLWGGIAHPRSHCFFEYFSPNGTVPPTFVQKAVCDERYKLVAQSGRPLDFFDLLLDPAELMALNTSTLNPTQRVHFFAAQSALNSLGF